jgi:hypothetical protein
MTTPTLEGPLAPAAGSPPDQPLRAVPIGRRLAAVGLLAGAAGNTAEAVLGRWLLPDVPDASGRLIDHYAQHGTTIGAMATVGTLAIPFMVVGFLALTRLLGRGMRRTAGVAAGLLMAGMWGFAGVHLLEFTYHSVAEVGSTASLRQFVDVVEGNPYIGLLWGLPFLAGCVLGVVTLAVGLLRTGVLPRWIPACLLGFVVLDFTVGTASPVDPHWLYLLACVGAATAVLRMTDQEWSTGRTADTWGGRS